MQIFWRRTYLTRVTFFYKDFLHDYSSCLSGSLKFPSIESIEASGITLDTCLILEKKYEFLWLNLTQPIFWLYWRYNQFLRENKITLAKASSSPNIQNEIDNTYLQNLDKSVNWKNFSKVDILFYLKLL